MGGWGGPPHDEAHERRADLGVREAGLALGLQGEAAPEHVVGS
jgi:hypothetical protein